MGGMDCKGLDLDRGEGGIAMEYVDYRVYRNCGSFYFGLCWILAKLCFRLAGPALAFNVFSFAAGAKQTLQAERADCVFP